MTKKYPERNDARIFEFSVSDNSSARQVFVVQYSLEAAQKIVKSENPGATVHFEQTHDFIINNRWSVTTDQNPL